MYEYLVISPITSLLKFKYYKLEDIEETFYRDGFFNVYHIDIKNTKTNTYQRITSHDEWVEWRQAREKGSAWKPFEDGETDIQMQDRIPTTEEIMDAVRQGKEIYLEDGPFGPGTDAMRIKEAVPETGVKKYLGKTPVNPKHYQAYMSKASDGTVLDYEFPDLQWLESVQYKGKYKDQNVFVNAVLLQADKYLSRLGGKDDDVQEIKKAIWYLKFAAAFIKNGGPIRVVDIEKILGDEV